MSQRGYIHEIWLCPNEDGELLPTCVYFGPAGNSLQILILKPCKFTISSPTTVFTQHQSLKTINHILSLGTLNNTTTYAASNNALKSFASLSFLMPLRKSTNTKAASYIAK
jgi:hypothetical protein